MIYFTSDLHLGHADVIKFSKRPFSSVDEMNETLVRNINHIVGKTDELWIIDDFAYKIDREKVCEHRRSIKCKNVHLVMGNHDRDYSQDNFFQSVQHYKELKTVYGRFILFHYPILEWNAAHYGSVHLHGHLHSTGEYNTQNLTKKYADRLPEGQEGKDEGLKLRIYDVGVDANDYKPISLDQIAVLMHLRLVGKNS